MIKIELKLTGNLVDKPFYKSMIVNENDIALERKNEATGKFEKITVGRLFAIHSHKADYITDSSEPEDHLTPAHFEQWVWEKYLKESTLSSRIIAITYTQIKT